MASPIRQIYPAGKDGFQKFIKDLPQTSDPSPEKVEKLREENRLRKADWLAAEALVSTYLVVREEEGDNHPLKEYAYQKIQGDPNLRKIQGLARLYL